MIEVYDDLPDGLIMNEDHLVLPDGEWVRACKRWVDRDLFVYWHKEHETQVFCEWAKKEGVRVCVELLASEVPFDRGGWMPKKWVQMRCRSSRLVAEEMLRTKAEQKRDLREGRIEAAQDKNEKLKYMRHKGMGDLADSMARQPWATDRTTDGGVTRLKEAMKPSPKIFNV